jgi:hypothetical protein
MLVLVVAAGGCGGSRRPDGLDASQLPTELRTDYALFAYRCSRCHSLSRALDANVSNDHWVAYITRMRHMPGSGISDPEAARILGLLFYLNTKRGVVDAGVSP